MTTDAKKALDLLSYIDQNRFVGAYGPVSDSEIAYLSRALMIADAVDSGRLEKAMRHSSVGGTPNGNIQVMVWNNCLETIKKIGAE